MFNYCINKKSVCRRTLLHSFLGDLVYPTLCSESTIGCDNCKIDSSVLTFETEEQEETKNKKKLKKEIIAENLKTKVAASSSKQFNEIPKEEGLTINLFTRRHPIVSSQKNVTFKFNPIDMDAGEFWNLIGGNIREGFYCDKCESDKEFGRNSRNMKRKRNEIITHIRNIHFNKDVKPKTNKNVNITDEDERAIAILFKEDELKETEFKPQPKSSVAVTDDDARAIAILHQESKLQETQRLRKHKLRRLLL